MHSPLPSCTNRVEVAGDGCRDQSEVIKEESTVVGDQKEEQQWERLTALKQRQATTRNSSVSGQPVGLTEYRCDVYIRVHRLQAELQF